MDEGVIHIAPLRRELGTSELGATLSNQELASQERDLLEQDIQFSRLEEGTDRLRTDVFDGDRDGTGEDEEGSQQRLGGHLLESSDEDDRPQKSWRIVTPKGIQKLSVADFRQHFNLHRSDGEMLESANQLTHKKITLDWVQEALPFQDGDELSIRHDMDFICVIGRVFKPLVLADQYALTFSTVSLSIGLYWRDYDIKRRLRLAYTLRKRSFYLGASNFRMHWYVVMIPIRPDTATALKLKGPSAMDPDRAKELASFIVGLFQTRELSGVGMDRESSLGDSQSYTLNCCQWATFQTLLMASWKDTLRVLGCDPYWNNHKPALHVIDFGQKLELKINKDRDSQVLGRELEALLSSQFTLENVATVKYALGTVIRVTRIIDGEGINLALVSNRESIEDMYTPENARKVPFTYYPLALSPRAGNWQSSKQPPFLDDQLWGSIAYELSEIHRGLDIITPESFQGYWEGKQLFRVNEEAFLARKCLYTGGLCIGTLGQPIATVKKIRRMRAAVNRYNPGSRRPIEREIERVTTAVDSDKIGFRIEPVVSLNISLLEPEYRNWGHIVDAVFLPQIEYWEEYAEMFVEKYLLLFHPDVFPCVLLSQGLWGLTHLETLADDLRMTPSTGLSAANCERCSIVERIMVYAFTGDRCILVLRLFRPLGLMDALENGGWVWIDQNILDFGAGKMNRSRWPLNEKSLPILCHLAAIKYHHGDAACRGGYSLEYLGKSR